MSTSPQTIIAQDTTFPGPGVRRIHVDTAQRVVVFENCHFQKRFLSTRWDVEHTCSFDDILSAREFGVGKHESIFVGTTTGRCRLFANWKNYEAVRDVFLETARHTPSGSWEDDPRIIGVIAGVFVILLVVILWIFL